MSKKIVSMIIITIVIVIIGAFIGSWLWNGTISDELGWTQHITAWQFFKMELIAWFVCPHGYSNKN